jgi:SAM-dependent methyltransferase
VKKVLSENKLPIEHIRILEVGSGLGYLTYSLVKAGYDAKGLDISESAVKQASGRFGNYYLCGDVRQLAISDQGKYDYVISTEVIEHIDDPSGFMGAILSLLKPGGKAIITTPGKSAYPDDIIWASDLPPVHLWWFSEESIKYIASQLNASVKFIDKYGSENTHFSSGDKMTIRIMFKMKERTNDLIFGLIIYSESGVYCYGTNTELKKFEIGYVAGDNAIDLVINHIPMYQGKYYLTVAVHSRDNEPYDWHNKMHFFTVHNPTQNLGLFDVPCYWKLKNGD